jgi:hypothetical protein
MSATANIYLKKHIWKNKKAREKLIRLVNTTKSLLVYFERKYPNDNRLKEAIGFLESYINKKTPFEVLIICKYLLKNIEHDYDVDGEMDDAEMWIVYAAEKLVTACIYPKTNFGDLEAETDYIRRKFE